MKANKAILKRISAFVFALTFMVASVCVAGIQAEAMDLPDRSKVIVTFRSGEHGQFSNGKTVEEREYEVDKYIDLANVAQGIDVEAGYYIRAWKVVGDLGADGSQNEYSATATSPQVKTRTDVIPQYARIVNEATYQVSYVDRMGVQIAQPVIGTHEAGAGLTLVAPAIAGYTLTGSQHVAITPTKNATIGHTFVYASNTGDDAASETVITEGTTVVPGAAAGTAATGTAATGTATAAGTTADAGTTVADGDVPLEERLAPTDEPVTAEDGGVPLDEEIKKETTEKATKSNGWMIYLGAAVVILLATGIIIYLKVKKPNVNKMS
ncbi:hypothetical protein M2145_001399 [Lachnospiraceae bacterium PF1-21]|uniref:MucBP domain-containing protein n=1 Tax=Ohessyouella blattaphilus TaxID=2949333 RepID=A0ABT1EKF7_9FIRM|nr:hypothetical protein [Ohessyouella blattaphilus]MCP1111194.1 hypothetical protein [Ohessyouella blattaphilus]MCR8564588.1 hypothetical protein [Ohessyouella blattaphilus]